MSSKLVGYYLKWFPFLILFGLIAFMAVFTYVNFFDYKIDFLNPPEKLNYKEILLYYPPLSTPIPVGITGTSDLLLGNQPLIFVDIILQYNGLLAEGSRVNVTGFGVACPAGHDIMGSYSPLNYTFQNAVFVGFEGASSYNSTILLTPQALPGSRGQFVVNLANADTCQTVPPFQDEQFSPVQSIIWDTQGDYYPYLFIILKNGSFTTAIYSDYKIHVSGSDTALQEKYSRINMVLSSVLLVFAFVTSLDLLMKYRPK